MNHSEKAVDYFLRGYNCSQATAAAFAEDAGLDPETIFKMMAGFGGGVGGQRDMCGAVSGMVFTLGLFRGDYAPNDTEAKKALYRLIKESSDEFKKNFETTNCKELLLKASCIPAPEPSVRNAEYYAKRPCAHFVRAAAEITEKYLGEATKER